MLFRSVSKYGMSDDIGPVVYGDENGEVFLGRDFSHANNYSEATSARIDAEIERMMRNAYDLTKNILTAHNDKLVLVAETLLEREKITGEEFISLMKTGALPVAEEKDLPAEDEDEKNNNPSENLSEDAAESAAENETAETAEEAQMPDENSEEIISGAEVADRITEENDSENNAERNQ